MEYPPPPSLVFLAYMEGSITESELKSMLELWEAENKSDPPKEEA